ncbi:pentatricopeptide repeat-containing protein [Panicum miliaceum]|uniref:Pentatricopeptide repeat-containing protein n=1 Tax=Panicum miliaceum TaxID=4540 RepID=A0A3L6R4B7_PANMI|nr:pentatricopeptide repeat-containing protein [Panicum miliaceum]
MWRLPPAAALLLLRRSLGATARLSAPRCLVRALLHEEQPTVGTNSLMTVRYLQWCCSDNDDDYEAIEAFKHYCSTTASSSASDASASTAYVEKLCKSGNLLDAVRVVRHLRDEQIHVSLHTFNMLLQQAAEANGFALFAKVFRYLLLSKLAPDSTSYMNVAKALQKLDGCELILKFVREILEITQDRDPTVMNRIIFATAKYGDIDKSLIIFEELKKDRTSLDVVTFNTILDMLGKAGRVDQMLHEVKLMEELGHYPDIVTYNTIINCLRRLGRLDLCKRFAGEMLERGVNPDLRTYTALINSFGQAGHITEALEMLDEMKMSHKPSVYVYRALISDLKKAGQFELAQKLSEEMNSSASDLFGPEDFKQKNKGRWFRDKR